MKIKTFKFPTFEEWKNNLYKDINFKLGAYRCQIAVICCTSRSLKKNFCFAVSLNNLEPSNIFSSKLFYRTFQYTGNNKNLKKWYEYTIKEFDSFWKKYIIDTYFEN